MKRGFLNDISYFYTEKGGETQITPINGGGLEWKSANLFYVEEVPFLEKKLPSNILKYRLISGKKHDNEIIVIKNKEKKKKETKDKNRNPPLKLTVGFYG